MNCENKWSTDEYQGLIESVDYKRVYSCVLYPVHETNRQQQATFAPLYILLQNALLRSTFFHCSYFWDFRQFIDIPSPWPRYFSCSSFVPTSINPSNPFCRGRNLHQSKNICIQNFIIRFKHLHNISRNYLSYLLALYTIIKLLYPNTIYLFYQILSRIS